MKRIYYVVLAIILLCGCDSFLDVTPKGMLLPEKVQDFVIRQENVTEALKKLSAMSYDERCRTKGLMPERADIIVAGIAILDSLMEYLALSEITVSDRDLSEGLLDADVLVPNEPK